MLQLSAQIVVDKHTSLEFISPQHLLVQIVQQIHSSFELYLVLVPLLKRNQLPRLLVTVICTLLRHFLYFYIGYLHTRVDDKMPLLH